jgi:hypothetical protein
MLSEAQLRRFVEDGFVRIDGAFPRQIADMGLAALWRAIGCDRHDPATWTRPVIRVGPANDEHGTQPLSFREAANTPILYDAFDKLVGPGRWQPRPNVGNFVVRFPSQFHPGDLGWHVDVSFPGETGDPEGRDYSAWRVNITSRGRALLMLFLFSDVGENDAPTRIRVGSHLDMPRILAPAGEAGMAHLQLDDVGAERDIALATGEAGTVFLCHPFLIHAAQKHRGTTPRFMSQPPLAPATPLRLERADGAYSPVEIAIRKALKMSGAAGVLAVSGLAPKTRKGKTVAPVDSSAFRTDPVAISRSRRPYGQRHFRTIEDTGLYTGACDFAVGRVWRVALLSGSLFCRGGAGGHVALSRHVHSRIPA